MVRGLVYLRLRVALMILHVIVRRLAINVSMEPPAFQEFRRSRPPREMVTTDRFWRHHNHGEMNFCEAESRIRTTFGGTMAPYRSRNRVPKETNKRRSSPPKLDMIPTISSIKLPIVRCESPTAIWECEGDCRSKSLQTVEAAHVVSYMSV